MYVEIITPEKILHSGKAKLIQLPGESGMFEIMINHAPVISSLKAGKVKVIDQEGKKYFFDISGGVVECKSNQVILLANNGNAATE
jgi:F-type H+-transporting ATPase subunit epsilon